MNRTQPKRTVARPRSKGKPISKAALAALNDERERLHITLQMVADEAAKTARFGTMGVPTVSSVLKGDSRSQNVIDALKRLIAKSKEFAA